MVDFWHAVPVKEVAHASCARRPHRDLRLRFALQHARRACRTVTGREREVPAPLEAADRGDAGGGRCPVARGHALWNVPPVPRHAAIVGVLYDCGGALAVEVLGEVLQGLHACVQMSKVGHNGQGLFDGPSVLPRLFGQLHLRSRREWSEPDEEVEAARGALL